MKNVTAMTEFFNTSNTEGFLPLPKKSASMIEKLTFAIADVFSGNYEKREAQKKKKQEKKRNQRQLFQNDCVRIAKVEENLEEILNRYSSLLVDLYVYAGREYELDTRGEFVNLLDLCVQEGDGAFEIVTNWVRPDELFWGIEDDRGNMTFEPYPDAFRKLHFLEWRREELQEKRDRLMCEYGALYDEKAGDYTDFNWHYHPKKEKTA